MLPSPYSITLSEYLSRENTTFSKLFSLNALKTAALKMITILITFCIGFFDSAP
jgi:hypothetical protein